MPKGRYRPRRTPLKSPRGDNAFQKLMDTILKVTWIQGNTRQFTENVKVN